jgi:uncharacterized protein
LPSPENPQLDLQALNGEPRTPAPLVADPFPPPGFLPAPPTPEAGENPVWSGWDVLQIAGLTLATLFITQLLIVLGARHYAFPHESFMEVAQKPSLAILAELLTYIAVALYMILLIEGKYHARFGEAIRWNWPGMAAVSLLGLGVLMLGLDLLGRFFPMPKSTPFDQFFAHRSDAYLTAVFAVTLGPLMEELFFRGFLYPVIARRMGVVWGVLLTALPFGLIHMVQYGYAWGAVLIIFLVGVVLTSVRAVTKSVASSFLVHVGYNGTLMVLAAWATDGFRHMDKAGVLLF